MRLAVWTIAALLAAGTSVPVLAQTAAMPPATEPAAPAVAQCSAVSGLDAADAEIFLQGYMTGRKDWQVVGELGYTDAAGSDSVASETPSATAAAPAAGIETPQGALAEGVAAIEDGDVDIQAVIAACKAAPDGSLWEAIQSLEAPSV